MGILKKIILERSKDVYYYADIIIAKGYITDILWIDKVELYTNDCKYFITPGFFNGHLHPNQLSDRGYCDKMGLDSILSLYHLTQKSKNFETRLLQSKIVILDAVMKGATSIYAVASNPMPIILSLSSLGMQGAVSCFFNDCWLLDGPAPAITDITGIRKHFEKYINYQSDYLDIHIGTASIMTASDNLLKLMHHISHDYNTKVNLHVSESINHVESCIKKRNVRPVALLKNLKVLDEKWNLIHCVNINDEEIKYISDSGANVIHCPVSNAKTGVGIAPIKKLINNKVNVVLGTDACSNNNTNNILNEAYFSILVNNISGKPMEEFDNEVWNMLTENANKVLDKNKLQATKYITKGKRANFLVWDLSEVSFCPRHNRNLKHALLYSAPDLKPISVYINGQQIIKDYKPIVDIKQLVKEFNDICNVV